MKVHRLIKADRVTLGLIVELLWFRSVAAVIREARRALVTALVTRYLPYMARCVYEPAFLSFEWQ